MSLTRSFWPCLSCTGRVKKTSWFCLVSLMLWISQPTKDCLKCLKIHAKPIPCSNMGDCRLYLRTFSRCLPIVIEAIQSTSVIRPTSQVQWKWINKEKFQLAHLSVSNMTWSKWEQTVGMKVNCFSLPDNRSACQWPAITTRAHWKIQRIYVHIVGHTRHAVSLVI